MARVIRRDSSRADNVAAELMVEELLEAFRRIKDPEVRSSIVALVTTLAETSLRHRAIGKGGVPGGSPSLLIARAARS